MTLGSKHRTRRRRRRHEAHSLRCESLESRYLLATFTVNTPQDVVNAADGVTSLREAVNQANANLGADDIEFDPSLGGAFVQLTAGELEVTDSVNIRGLGNSGTNGTIIGTDDATDDVVGDGFRIFNINDGSPGNIEVTVADMILVDGDSSGFGGAIYTEESLTVLRVLALSNTSASAGGFVFASLSGGASLVIDDSTIDDGSSGTEGGGVAAFVYGGSVNITESTITGNTSTGDGGGIYIYGDSASNDISINNTEVIDNTGDIGGGIMLYTASGGARIEGSVISGNTARRGAGAFGLIGAGSEATVAGTLLSNNIASERGGGLGANVGGTLNVMESRVTGNEAADGSGAGLMFTADGTANIDSSAIVANTATASGGGVSIDFQTTGATANVLSSTISGNTSGDAPGLGSTGDGAVSIRHSTIARNNATAPSAAVKTTGQDVTVTHSIIADQDLDIEVNAGILDLSFSLIGTNAGSGLTESPTPDANGNLIGGAVAIDPLLSDLGANGGSTDSHGLMDGSPAIDAGADVLVDAPDLDQRRGPFTRVFDGDSDGNAKIDMGATERIVSGLIVDTTDDELDGDISTGDLSLREAIALGADRSATSGIVTFDAGLGGMLSLTSGQILIDNPVVIQGPGAEQLTISAAGNDPTPTIKQGDGSRIFEITDKDVDRNLAVEISGLTLTGGDVTGEGGAISARENLILRDATVTENHSQLSADTAGFDGDGGGIWARTETGEIRIVNTLITDNTSDDDGGGLNLLAGEGLVVVEDSTVTGNVASGLSAVGPNVGGGIRGFADETGELRIINSTITGNSGESLNTSAEPWGGGGIGFVGDGLVSVTGSTISENMSGANGGGLYMDTGRLEITDSMIADNTAGQFGGGVHVEGRRISDTEVDPGELVIANSTISGNTAQIGGGGVASFVLGDTSIESSTVDGNDADNGGGLFNLNDLNVSNSTISNNTGDLGGAVSNGWLYLAAGRAYGGTMNMLNSTISGNEATGFGAGLFNVTFQSPGSSVRHTTISNNMADSDQDDSGSGGGVYTFYGRLDIDHSIIAANQVTAGGAPDMEIDPNGLGGTRGVINLTNSLVGDNTNAELSESQVPDPDGNIIGGPTDGVVDPLLGPLADNGGPTMTHALLDGSPAIDNGDQANATIPDFDQRGEPFARIFNGEIDMGAFETQSDVGLLGDFDGDGEYTCDDIDALVIHIRDGMSDSQFDLNGDGSVDGGDIDQWLDIAGNANQGRPYLSGDANLNGIVDAQDLNVVGQAWLQQVDGWCAGDFTADGLVDPGDLNELGQNWQMSAPLAAARAPRAPLAAGAAGAADDVLAPAITDFGRSGNTVFVLPMRDLAALDDTSTVESHVSEQPRSQRRQLKNQYRRGTKEAEERSGDVAAVVDQLLAGWDM